MVKSKKWAKKTWSKIDSSDIIEANLKESRSLLKRADPQHKANDELFFLDTKGSCRRPGRREPWELKSTSIIKANPKIEAISKARTTHKAKKVQASKQNRSVDCNYKESKELTPESRSFDLWSADNSSSVVISSQNDGPNCERKETTTFSCEWLHDQNIDPLKRLRASNDSNRSKKILSKMKPEPSCHIAVDLPHAGSNNQIHQSFLKIA